MIFDHLEIKKFQKHTRWRGGLVIRYVQTNETTSAMRLAADYFNSSTPQRPHLTLLYDYDGYSSNVPNVNITVLKRLEEKGVNLSWTAKSIAIVYTPIRKHFKSSQDMRNLVNHWSVVTRYQLST